MPRGHAARALSLGNELLPEVDVTYPDKVDKPNAHTVALVLRYLARRALVSGPGGFGTDTRLANAADVFVGYLLLDALIGNTDRHHENWGVLVPLADDRAATVELAPSFDHASSLGRELSNTTRAERLATRDSGRTVAHYCGRGRSSFFATKATGGGVLSPRQAFEAAARRRPAAAAAWLERLRAIGSESTHSSVRRVPDTIMSGMAKEFAIAMLDCNSRFLLEQVPS